MVRLTRPKMLVQRQNSGSKLGRCGWLFGIPVLSASLLCIEAVAVNPKVEFKEGLSPADQQGTATPCPENFLKVGTVLYLRLETPVSTKASHLRDPVSARVVREVIKCEKVAIPLGSTVRGRVEKLIPSSNPADRARVRLDFIRLEVPGQPAFNLSGHIKEVENAREKVLPDGTIQGVLASELPLAHLEAAIEKLGKGKGEIRRAAERTLGRSDTSIDYPAVSDLVWVLDMPLKVAGSFDSAVPAVLGKGNDAALEQSLADAPRFASGKDGEPGDPLNLIFVGNADEIRRAFQEAGWSEAEKKTAKTVWETVRAILAERGYGAGPVSDLYLYGRMEDLAFEKMLNTFTKRHHLRLWRSPTLTPDGREIWLAAATHDIGLDVRPGVISHAIDPEIDAERVKVGADLAATGRVAAESLLDRSNPLREGLTATGGRWMSDGKLLVIELKSQ